MIKLLIEAIKKINEELYIGNGNFEKFNYTFYEPVDKEDLKRFECKYNCTLPEDYKNFLLITNGIMFYNSADFKLFNLDEVIEDKEYMGFKEGIYPIGYILEDYIAIDINTENNNIYVGNACSGDEYYSLNCNFTVFMDRLIISNITNYWTWVYPERFYKLLN
jgi:hypothetical protein